MGTVSTRTLSDGTLRFRAEIRINRKEYPVYKESKTFSTKRLAQSWLKKREVEIEINPNILLGSSTNLRMTLSEAIDKYLNELDGVYSNTKVNCLKLVKRFPIAKKCISRLTAADYFDHVQLRKMYYPKVGVGPICESSILHELMQIRSVLSHASIMWDMSVDLDLFRKTQEQLKKNRQISPSKVRDRLPTNTELKKLLCYFYDKWILRKYTRYPMHIICLLAIFSCRRQAEITRMELSDYDEELQAWQVRDLKNPKGSKGNHKSFVVSDDCRKVIEMLMQPEIRKRFKSKNENKYLVPLQSQTISLEFMVACRELGIQDLRFHDLRHEGCTRLAENGFTIPQIQQYSLHDCWQSLQRYVSIKKRKEPLSLEEMLHLIDVA